MKAAPVEFLVARLECAVGGSSVRVPVGKREHGYVPVPCVESLPDRGAVGLKFVFTCFQRIWKVIEGRSATPLRLIHYLVSRTAQDLNSVDGSKQVPIYAVLRTPLQAILLLPRGRRSASSL
jgi:hypothetical protein